MTWLTWRQFRSQTWVAVGALFVIGAGLLVAANALAALYTDSGAAACHTACESVIANFLQQAHNGWTGFAYDNGIAVLYVAPALIGAFWGAPLVARELEAGTHRLAWNQSVTRTRWLLTKLAIVGSASAATMGLLSLAVMWYSRRIDQGTSEQIQPLYFGARGIVPIAYGLFAFAVGVAAGILIRRTVPAMAVTLAVYIGVAVAMPLWVRAHLMPVSHSELPLDTQNINGLMLNEESHQLTVIGDSGQSGWILSNQTITPGGAEFTGPADPQFCSGRTSPGTCLDWINTLNLRQSVAYQPGSHFWPLQWIEAGIFLALVAVLVAICVRWTRRLV